MINEQETLILREFINFVNMQVGVYMDAVAGFQGHRTRTARQIHRVARSTTSTDEEAGRRTVVWASYEDPSQPDVIHNRIIRATDYLALNAEDGTNYQQHSRAVLIFLFTYWEDVIRPRLASAASVSVSEIRSDVMGDLRILRNVILHSQSILSEDKYRSLKVLNQMFRPDSPLNIRYEDMHQIFILIKKDIARRLPLPFSDLPVSPADIRDIAIQRL